MRSETGPTLTVVSRSFPPYVQGSAILLANLLTDYSGPLTAVSAHSRFSPADPAFQAPCHTRYLSLPRLLSFAYDGLARRAPASLADLLEGPILRCLRRMNASVVLGAFPTEEFLVAAFRAARRLELPFYVHMHDLWEENMPPGSVKERFARQWEPLILQGATRVLCMTPAMQRHYRQKYDIATDLLPHAIPTRDFETAAKELRPGGTGPLTVLFVGGVNYVLNLDALRMLAAASELLPPEYTLLYCTSLDKEALGRAGIQSSRLQARYVSRAEVQRLQAEASVLVAPLSHKDCSLPEVRTVFSTKLLEYLLAGRPILVFAPPDSFHARSAQERGWGYVVSEDSPEALADGIVRVATDQELAARLVQGALCEAAARQAKVHADQLLEWVCADSSKRRDTR